MSKWAKLTWLSKGNSMCRVLKIVSNFMKAFHKYVTEQKTKQKETDLNYQQNFI